MLRGRLFWTVVLPKSELVGSRFGSLNWAWLVAFKKSARRVSRVRSRMAKFLLKTQSHRFNPCPRNHGNRDASVLMLLESLIRVSARCFAGSGTPLVWTAASEK